VADALRRRLSLAFFAADEPAVLLLRAVAIERAMVEEERERFEEKGGEEKRAAAAALGGEHTRSRERNEVEFFFFFFSKRVFCRLSSTSSTSTRAPIFPHFSQRDNDPILFLALARSLPRENPFLSVFLYPLIA
jgi:hypothetical protein